MTELVTGARYVEQITARASDRNARAAFRERVIAIAPQGGRLFDFGCGTGMDARFYAERGFMVQAYDLDAQMCEFFATECSDLIEAGRVRLEGGAYADFLGRHRGAAGSVDLVTANFAPLNLIVDLQQLFAVFHALTAPRGGVLASVLSPYYFGDLQYPWWWRNLPALVRQGRYSVPGAQAPITRRRLEDFAAQSAPYFTLQRVFAGSPVSRTRDTRGIDVSAGVGRAWLRLTTCRFMFLQFVRLG